MVVKYIKAQSVKYFSDMGTSQILFKYGGYGVLSCRHVI